MRKTPRRTWRREELGGEPCTGMTAGAKEANEKVVGAWTRGAGRLCSRLAPSPERAFAGAFLRSGLLTQ